jgi:ABC-type tungstate transport system permease subunit
MNRFGKRAWVLLAAVAMMAGAGTSIVAQSNVVRLALVNVPDELIRPLLPEFEHQTGLRAEIVYAGNNPFAVAREGKADLVISHYGHEGVQPFVAGEYGLWPAAVFANQMVLLGPKSDPARVRNLADAAEAFRRIAASRSPFMVNNGAGARYLEEILWACAGRQLGGSRRFSKLPDRSGYSSPHPRIPLSRFQAAGMVARGQEQLRPGITDLSKKGIFPKECRRSARLFHLGKV